MSTFVDYQLLGFEVIESFCYNFSTMYVIQAEFAALKGQVAELAQDQGVNKHLSTLCLTSPHILLTSFVCSVCCTVSGILSHTKQFYYIW